MKMMPKSRQEALTTAKNALFVTVGTFLLAFGTGVFVVPFNLVAGGMSGIGIILAEVIKVPFLTVDVYVSVLTWFFFFAGLILLGKSFAMKTLASTLLYPPLLSLCMRLASPNVLGGLLYIADSGYGDAAIIIAAVFGGLLIGVGLALSFLGGGSTGGVDVIALTISGKFKRIKSAQVLLAIDTVVILVGAFVMGDLVISLLGIISAFVSSVTIDRIFDGGRRAFIANIISDKYEQINAAIISDLNRTGTIIPCIGGYTGKERKMVMVSFSMAQYALLLSTVLKIDRDAFITIHGAKEINGEGWTWEQDERSEDK
jgi:uncharacterized membrane-anchored protein YitT (DUF2179 family)